MRFYLGISQSQRRLPRTFRPWKAHGGKRAHHCHKETVPLKHGPVLAKCKWETIFCGHHRSILNHCDVIGLQSFRIRWNNARYVLLRRSGSFKVTDIGTNRKPVCNFLLVINTNWHPISYRFEVIANYCLNFGHCVFESPFGGLVATCTVHLRLIKKLVVDFLFVLIEHFQRLVVTAEGLRANIDWKSTFLKRVGQFRPNFHVAAYVSREPFFCTDRQAISVFARTGSVWSKISDTRGRFHQSFFVSKN